MVIMTLALIGLLSVLWMLYRLIAPPPEGELPQSLVRADEGADVDILSLLGGHLSRSEYSHNSVKLLVNGDRIFPPMLSAIEEAKHTVNLLTYVYWTGDIADRFAEALIKAAQRGVTVRLLVDAFGGSPMDTRLIESMRDAGVQFSWFHPVRWYNMHRLNMRTHRKILVVDSAVAFVGGVGIAQEWMGDAKSADEWRDNHFEVRGPAVQGIEGGFTENWLNGTGELLVPYTETMETDGRHIDHTTDYNAAGRLLVLTTSTRGDLSSVALTYWAILACARGSVDIATPYFVPNDNLLKALLDAATRGIRIRLLVPGDHNDSRMVRWACQAHYDELLQTGVEIYEFEPSMMHTKTIVIDSQWSLFGSANFDHRSIALNDEIVLISDSTELARELDVQFEQDIRQSQRVEDTRRRPVRRAQRLFASMALLMQAQL